MDMMEVRRRVLVAVMGGEQMVGELSKYQKITGVTTTDSRRIIANHTLGAIPKIVIVTNKNEHDSGSTLLGYIILSQIAGASVTYSNAPNAYTVYTDSTTLSNATALLLDTSIEVRQASANRSFSTSDTYTVELYA